MLWIFRRKFQEKLVFKKKPENMEKSG